MKWGKKIIGGRVYDLAHLDPFILPVTPKALGSPTFNVRVSIGCHVFTDKWDPSYTPDLKFTDGLEERCFSTDRYALSQNLPIILKQASSGKAHFTNIPNTFVVSQNLPGLTGPYAVFFKVTKADSSKLDARLIVVSAYEKPSLPNRLKAITFATLVSNTVSGKPIKRPKK